MDRDVDVRYASSTIGAATAEPTRLPTISDCAELTNQLQATITDVTDMARNLVDRIGAQCPAERPNDVAKPAASGPVDYTAHQLRHAQMRLLELNSLLHAIGTRI